ncbi:MAG: lamin tail domain-containing protein [Ignavibacteriaceae bacterium]
MNVFTKVRRTQILILFIASLFGLLTANNFAQTPHIFINEFLASNLTTNPDMVDFDDFSDWIELYNDETSAVDIGGFYITDDLTQPMKWQIPANTIIPAKGYFLIWADGYDDIPGNTYAITGFILVNQLLIVQTQQLD